MDFLDEEILGLWRSFYKRGLKYIMVGGFATNLNGFSRTTADLDIWIDDTLVNRKILRQCLNDIEAGDFPFLETSELVPGWTSVKLQSGFELDIMTYIAGFKQDRFEEIEELSPVAFIDEVPIKFIHINQLIEAKKASGRPRDLIDVEELEKIRNNN